MSHASLDLYLVEDPHREGAPSLAQTCFSLSSNGPRYRCIRGRTSGPRESWGSFQWSHAVRALTILSIRHLLSGSPDLPQVPSYIEGDVGSPAASLDYAISKEPQWLCDMFGLQPLGATEIKTIFLRTNANRKLPGAVLVGFNGQVVEPKQIKIFLDHRPLATETELLDLLNALEGNEQEHVCISSTAAIVAAGGMKLP